MEMDMIIGDTDKYDSIDAILPKLTIAERGELLKIIILPVMLIIKNFFDFFFVNTEDKVLQIFHELPYTQRTLAATLMNTIGKSNLSEEKKKEL